MSETTTPFRPSRVEDLVRAWKLSGRRAQVLETRLHQAVEVARRYRRDLLRLAEQNRSRKLQAEELQQKLLQLLERPVPAPQVEALPPLPEGDEQVPATYVRQLLLRLREAHDLVAEMETLLEFRERQVHQLLTQAGSEGAGDWRVSILQRELTDARHRIRLLTQELSAQPASADSAQRVAELEARLAEVMQHGDQALAGQLQAREQQVGQLQEQLNTRVEELKKAVGHIQQARERIRTLESELEAARQAASQDETGELLNEITALQDEIARLQEESDRHAARAAGADPGLARRVAELEAENQALKGDAQKMARLEAGVVELRQKLQLAGSKYQEVKAALIEKHQQLVQLQGRSQESMQPLVRTLETALEEARRQNAALQQQIEMLKRRGEAPVAEPSEALASMEAKLKEARRSAVRAQAEAGLKRKEMARLQEEVEALKAKVVALGGSL